MEKSEYYVYVHKRASDGQPFYYGRGKDRRAWEPYRNPWHANIVAKHGVIVEILQTGLTRDEGSALECQLIAAGKLAGEPLVNLTRGGDGQDPEISRKVGANSYARKVGIHAPGMAQKGGHSAGCKARDLKIGFHDPKYAGAGGRKSYQSGVGIFSDDLRGVGGRASAKKQAEFKKANPDFKREFSQEHRAKLSAAKIGKKQPPVSAETREKMSISAKAWRMAKSKQLQK